MIWGVHLLIYYPVYSIVNGSNKGFEKLYYLFLTPLAGLFGFFERVPFFICLPILLMLFLINLNHKWYLNHIFSVIFSYLIVYPIVYEYTGLIHSIESTIDLLKTFSVCLIISCLVNWLIFKKQYQRLRQQETSH